MPSSHDNVAMNTTIMYYVLVNGRFLQCRVMRKVKWYKPFHLIRPLVRGSVVKLVALGAGDLDSTSGFVHTLSLRNTKILSGEVGT